MPEVQCKLVKITPLTSDISRVRLLPDAPLPYKAGQYLRVIMGEKDRRPFSIANAPGQDSYLELHIGAGPDNAYAGEVLEAMRTQGQVMIDGGHGKAYLRENLERPVLLLAGGTGFSYTYAILQQLLRRPYHEPIFLYWGTRSREDMYAYAELTRLQQEIEHFSFVPVVETPPVGWTGKTGWVHKAVMQDFVSLEPYHVYVAGRFEMAGAAREDFRRKGLLAEHLYGDAYEFI